MSTPAFNTPLIATGTLNATSLAGTVVIVTGAGGGIGFAAAQSLLWLGASVVVAEINEELGREAQSRLARDWGEERVTLVPTDVGDEHQVSRLVDTVEKRFGHIDAVLNNATFAPAGDAVTELPIDVWDRSYAVNLRGPVLLARACLPGMTARKQGVFVCVSSTGGPYMAPYETLKAAQLAFANSLDAELADTGVVAFTIGPGLVPTRTAVAAIERLAPRLGTTVQEFWAANRGAVLSVEAAGAGFAAAIALAARYPGQEISSGQALADAGIEIPSEAKSGLDDRAGVGDVQKALQLCAKVESTLDEQAAGWKQRSFFERQWMQRDFRQRVATPIERCLEMLHQLRRDLGNGSVESLRASRPTLARLSAFYGHMADLARGYVKSPAERDEQLGIIAGWKADVDLLEQVAGSTEGSIGQPALV